MAIFFNHKVKYPLFFHSIPPWTWTCALRFTLHSEKKTLLLHAFGKDTVITWLSLLLCNINLILRAGSACKMVAICCSSAGSDTDLFVLPGPASFIVCWTIAHDYCVRPSMSLINLKSASLDWQQKDVMAIICPKSGFVWNLINYYLFESNSRPWCIKTKCHPRSNKCIKVKIIIDVFLVESVGHYLMKVFWGGRHTWLS